MSEADKKARAAALAEKRQKLAKLRRRGTGTPASPPAASPAPATSPAGRSAAAARLRRGPAEPAVSPAPSPAPAPAPTPAPSAARASRQAPAQPPPAPVPAMDPADDLDEFIDGLLAENSVMGTPTAAAAAAPAAPAPVAAAGEAVAPPRLDVGELTFATAVATVVVASDATETYSKGTQTDAPAAPSSPMSPSAMPLTARPLEPNSAAASPSRLAGAAPNAADTKQGGEDSEGAAATVRQLEPEEVEAVVGSEDFSEFLTRSSRFMERALAASEQFNVFVDYGTDQETKTKDEDHELLRDYAVLTSDGTPCRGCPITDMHWSQHHNELIAVAYGNLDGPGKTPASGSGDGTVLVWSSVMTSHPEYVFTCQSPVLSLRFHDFMPNCIIGGTYSGRIVLWDMRAKSAPVQTTALTTERHAHPVYGLSLVGSTSANTLYSLSTDGHLCGWNTSNLTTPIMSNNLAYAPSGYRSSSLPVTATALSVAQGETSNFVVGSEAGSLYTGDFEGRQAGVKEQFSEHRAPITSLSHHPSSRRLLLSSSVDWSVKLWDLHSRPKSLMTFTSHSDYIYDVEWSPTHPAVFATADGSGAVDVWNIATETELPAFHKQVSEYALNRARWSHDSRMLAAGDSTGTLYLLKSAPEVVSARPEEIATFEEVVRHASGPVSGAGDGTMGAPPATA